MSKLRLILFITFLFSGSISFAQTGEKSIGSRDDEKLIDNQVNRMISDWNTHEFKNLDQYATEDVDWVNIVGMWWKGRTDVKKAHQITFDHFFNRVPFTRKSLAIKFLTNDVAIAHLVCHVGSLFPPDGIDRVTNRTPETDDLLTLIYVKRNGIWLLSAGQNTTIDPKAAKSNPISVDN
jgi:uncharacterized protein (TIGR02246 family)